ISSAAKPLGGSALELDARDAARQIEILEQTNGHSRRFCIDDEQKNLTSIAFGGDDDEVGDVGIRGEHLGPVETPYCAVLRRDRRDVNRIDAAGALDDRDS